MKRDNLQIAQEAIDRIFDNAQKDRGVRLSAEEVKCLTFTFLSNTQAERDKFQSLEHDGYAVDSKSMNAGSNPVRDTS